MRAASASGPTSARRGSGHSWPALLLRRCAFGGGGALRERMRVTMTTRARAAHLVGSELRVERSVIGQSLPVVDGAGVALPAIRVVVRLDQVNLLFRLVERHRPVAAEVVKVH